MNRFCRGVLFVVLLVFFSTFSSVAYAQTPTGVNISGANPIPASVPGILIPNASGGAKIIYPGVGPVDVKAQVGEFIVNISGLASPNASVVLTDAGGQFLKSTVADSTGNFTMSQITVRSGFDGFCLDSVDFRRLGETQGCMDFAPVTKSQDFKDVFIPPTIGLYQKRINEGDQALIYGFSMPEADVKVKVKENQNVDVKTDQTGYYEYRYPKVPAGTYDLSSTASYQNKESLKPKKSTKLTALSLEDQAISRTADTGKAIMELLFSTLFGFFLLVVFLIGIIIALIIIIRRGGIPVIREFIKDKLKHHKPLHHDWLLKFLDKLNIS